MSSTKREKHKEQVRELREVEAGLRGTEGSLFDRSSNGENGEARAEAHAVAMYDSGSTS